MRGREIAKNFLAAMLAQGVSFLLSAITSLLVPRLLGVESYGFWQLFLLYCSYVGFADLGISEGVYLINGGKNRNSLDCASLSGQFKLLLFIQFVMALAVAAVAILAGETSRSFILLSTGVYLVIVNASAFFYYTFQAVNETRRYSFAVVVDKVAFLFPLLALLIMRVSTFEPYVLAYLFSKAVALIYCIHFGKSLLKRGVPLSGHISDAFQSSRTGIKLLIANLAGTLAIGIARMTADDAWGIETFGQLSLAFTMCSFFLQCVYQLSMVLFPALRRLDDKALISFYGVIRSGLDAFLPIIYLMYYPVALFVSSWLPAYSDAVMYFAYLIPICIFDSRMDILGNTYLKVMRKETSLLLINVGSVIAGAIGSFAGAYVFNSIYAVIAFLVVVIFARCFVTELYLGMSSGVKLSLKSWTSLFASIIFIIANEVLSAPCALMATFIAVFVGFCINRDAIYRLINVAKG